MARPSYSTEHIEGEFTITVALHDCCLHLKWHAPLPGDPWVFDGITITDMNLDILQETSLLKQLSTLPFDTYPAQCEKLFKSWGWVKTR